MYKVATAVGLAVTLVSAANSAWAGDISCAWDNLPTAVREEFGRLARSSQPEKSLNLIDDPSMVGAIKACKFPTEPGARLVMAMGGLLNQRLAELHFAGLFTPEQLNAAWGRVDRAVVATAVATRARGFDPEAGSAAAEGFVRQLNLPATGNKRTRTLALVYANGRITRAYGEAGF